MNADGLLSLALIVGLGTLATGASMVGNAYFALEPAASSQAVNLLNSANLSNVYVAFLKPGDRIIFSYSSDANLTYRIRITDLASSETMVDATSDNALSMPFEPARRSLYLIDITATGKSISANSSYQFYNTLIGSPPTDFYWIGLEAIGVGGAFVLLCLFLRRRLSRRESMSASLKSRRVPTLLTLISWELSQSKALISVLILTILLYSGGAFVPTLHQLGSDAQALSQLPNLLNPSLLANKDWTNIYPIVAAAAAYSFSYEKDKMILRSVLMNPVRSSSVFVAKALSLALMLFVPVVVAFALTIALFVPPLLLQYPLVIFGNLLTWVEMYLLFFGLMLGFCLLPAVYFRKPIYAFIVPVLAYFVIETEGFGLSGYLPSSVLQGWGVLVLSNLQIASPTFEWGPLVEHITPAIYLAGILVVMSFACFQLRDRE